MTDWPPGIGLARFDEVDSTNEQARRLAEAGEAGPLWILADRQTSGRGRRGRAWESLTGNLTATLLLRPDAPADRIAQLSFAAALAVADVVRHFAPHAAITLKWPNDVLAETRKLAGILLESGPAWLAIGVGINLASAPGDTEFPATSLTALNVRAPAPEEALAILASRFAHWHRLWRDEGFMPLRTAWLEQADGLGGPIRARLPSRELRGNFEGIDAAGALLLNDRGQVSAITAGEVFFGH